MHSKVSRSLSSDLLFVFKIPFLKDKVAQGKKINFNIKNSYFYEACVHMRKTLQYYTQNLLTGNVAVS